MTVLLEYALHDMSLQFLGGRQSRRPASKVLPIPGSSKEPQQRVTRAQASWAALETKQQEAVGKAEPAIPDPLQSGSSPQSADPLIFLAVTYPPFVT